MLDRKRTYTAIPILLKVLHDGRDRWRPNQHNSSSTISSRASAQVVHL